ncbi:InlB B-repeat-containing protein [Rhodohalobacter barkolensis]|uniref:Bacterial repeat domain-containing protein n=1 Tax=Rhodohalobacter barkolensis TaxID=2053187 RepID=A0A2N0VH10_9BACT|nr:hypothetical protein [Rhodohalobacter barkolensis]PKD43470.1 hypothetical protein CWD77_07820 [Rhodohalobacter barkolensis]
MKNCSILLTFFVLILTSCGTESTPVYTLTTVVNGEGTVTPSSGEFEEGEVVTLTSNSDEGWMFQSWSGDGSGSSTSVSINMDSDKNVVGNFQRKDYPLNITVEGEGTVQERIISQPKSTDYPFETIVELTPIPEEGWGFIEWSGDLNGNEEPIQITVSGEKNVIVKFESKIKTFGGSKSDAGSDIIQTTDDGYILTGNTRSNDGDFSGMNKGSNDIIVMKLSSNGDIQWNNSYGGSESDMGNSIIQTTDGGYVLTGFIGSNDGDFSGMNRGSNDIFVMKLSSNGDIQWNNTFGGSGSEGGQDIIQTTDGGYILTGSTGSNDGDFSDMNRGPNDIFVMKLSSNGDIQWNKTYGGSGNDGGSDIIQIADGRYVLTGYTRSNNGDFSGMNRGSNDIFVMKLSSNGDIQWNSTFGGTESDVGSDIFQATDGGYVLTGNTRSNDGDFSGMDKGGADSFVIKLSSNGDILWNNTFGGSEYDVGSDIFQATDGGYVLTGNTGSNDGDFSGMNKGSVDIFIVKLSSNGNIQWNKTYGGGGIDMGYSMTSTTDGRYILTGFTNSTSGDFRGIDKGDIYIFAMKFSLNGDIEW